MPGWVEPAYLVTTFLAAFLLFQVQPLIGKIILPWFGGTASVWNICLLFFQTLLFAGYLYTHVTSTYLRPRTQLIVHSALLGLTLLALPILPQRDTTVDSSTSPTLAVLSLLITSVGLPYFLLSTTAPLIQRWWSMVVGRSPYHLYSLSNAGSLLALLSYSFVFERILGTTAQAYAWSATYVGLAAMLLACQWMVWRTNPQTAEEAASPSDLTVGESRESFAAEEGSAPTGEQKLAWLVLAGLGSALLMALTTLVCQDIASLPLLWIVPLTLYLLSFILCFGRVSWYRRSIFIPLMILGSFGVAASFGRTSPFSLVPLFTINLGALFSLCMVCHGELERLKPSPRYLTSFYLSMSAGGMLGGLFVGIVAPLVFHEYFELPLLMIASSLIPIVLLVRSPQSPMYGGRRKLLWLVVLPVFALHCGFWSLGLLNRHERVYAVTRNFYGVLKVVAEETPGFPEHEYLKLVNGNIEHGGQFLRENMKMIPTTYYSPDSAVGKVFASMENRPSRKIGAIGLGTGTVAAYGRKGDEFRFYEINPAVVPLARDAFSFLKHLDDVGAKQEIVIGDGRLALEHEDPQQFDLLIVDAFSGDSIPIHLLTREAAGVYLRHLKPNGYLAIHISNRYVDLLPIVSDLAIYHDMNSTVITNDTVYEKRQATSIWVLLTPKGYAGEIPGAEFAVPADIVIPPVAWTDQRSSLLEVLEY